MARPGVASNMIGNFFVALAQILRLFLDSISKITKRIIPFQSYLALTFEQIVAQGVFSLPVVILAGIATGSVMALQLGYGLQRFGGSLYVPAIVSIAILRELGPILTSLLLAARIGSGITAEIASMAASEQVDAIIALGGDPRAELVVPRIVACTLVFPILSLVGDYLGVLSAMWVDHGQFAVPFGFFLSKAVQAVRLQDVFGGLLKSTVFGFCISLVACWKGLTTRGGTRGVGASTTEVVVLACAIVLVGDVFLTKLLIGIGWYAGGPG